MAEFNTKCPHCSAKLLADEEWLGMEVECPACRQTFTVEKETPPPPKLSLPSSQPKPPAPAADDENTEKTFVFVCPECGTQAELPIALKGTKYECKACCEESVAEPATEKKCPHCGQMIKFHATICKYCKKNVDISATAAIGLQPVVPTGNPAIGLQPVSTGSAPLTLSPANPDLTSWKITRQEIESINKNFMFWWIGLAGGTLLLIILIGIPVLIASAVFWFILIYQFWKLVPVSEAETTPGKAVGFMFIPFFNFYWVFVVICGLSKHFDRLAPNENIKTHGLILCISTCCCLIPFVNFVAPIVEVVFFISWTIRMKKIAVSAIPVID